MAGRETGRTESQSATEEDTNSRLCSFLWWTQWVAPRRRRRWAGPLSILRRSVSGQSSSDLGRAEAARRLRAKSGGGLRHREGRGRTAAAAAGVMGGWGGPGGLFFFNFFLFPFGGEGDGAAPAAFAGFIHAAWGRRGEAGAGPGRGVLSSRPRRGPTAHQ